MFDIFSRRKQLENSVQANASALEELQKSIADRKEIVNALAKSRNEEAAP